MGFIYSYTGYSAFLYTQNSSLAIWLGTKLTSKLRSRNFSSPTRDHSQKINHRIVVYFSFSLSLSLFHRSLETSRCIDIEHLTSYWSSRPPYILVHTYFTFDSNNTMASDSDYDDDFMVRSSALLPFVSIEEED